MIQEDYVSFEIAKLLKEKGFTEWCFKCYGVAVLHNGADISFDEECELKDEGRGDEIEYVEGGRLYDYGCNNREKVRAVWAAPTLWTVVKWLQKIHHILVVPDYVYECTDTSWVYKIYRLGENGKPEKCVVKGVSYDDDNNPTEHIVGYRDYELSYKDYTTREEACEAGIRYCLENLI